MIAEYATPADFEKWRARAETMSLAELRYTAKDCREAEAAMRGWNPIKEGFYSDQAATYGDELRRRRTTYSGTAQ
jgi:hypothetical protein